ncbi:MAG: hypothetical protein NTX50_23150 [Candidatus Sumerlaeota bacterium]|nr:hypothetical protein [Candidatus Sumerlaeota bacterium]
MFFCVLLGEALCLSLLAILFACSRTSSAPKSGGAGLQPEVIGSRGRLPGSLSFPRGIDFLSDGRMAVTDRTGRIQLLSPEGKPLRDWLVPRYDSGTPTRVRFDETQSSETTLLIADTHYSRILRYSLEGKLLLQFGEYGEAPGKMIYPTDIALNPKGEIYITEYGVHDRVMKFTREGVFIKQWGDFGTAPGQFQRPLALIWAPPDRLIVADTCNHRIQVFSEEGQLLEVWGGPGAGPGQFNYPYDLCRDAGGMIYVCEYGANRIQRLTPEGKPNGVFGEAGRRPGQFAAPWGIALAPKGRIAVADTENHRIQIFDAGKIFAGGK